MLAMTLAGAKHQTASEIRGVLCLDRKNDVAIHEWFEYNTDNLVKQLETSSIKLHFANRMYFNDEENITVRKGFRDVLDKYYHSDAECVKFEHDTYKEINRWVEEQTCQKIRDLIQPGQLNETTRLVLVNAIYFKGDWAYKFKSEYTAPGDFTIDDKSIVSVDIMHKRETFKYAENFDSQLLMLPYGNQQLLSMVLVLPKHDLRVVESSLSVDLPKLLQSVSRKRVDVSLPKFKLETSLLLADTLSAMGIKTVFSKGDADLSGITDEKDFYLSEIIHKAILEVDEEGCVAAAATANIYYGGTGSLSYTPFIVNRPVICLIRHNETGNIFFIGRLNNPAPNHDDSDDDDELTVDDYFDKKHKDFCD